MLTLEIWGAIITFADAPKGNKISAQSTLKTE